MENTEVIQMNNELLLAENEIAIKLIESYKRLYEKVRWDCYTLKLENMQLKRMIAQQGTIITHKEPQKENDL